MKRVLLTIPNIPPSPRIKEKSKHLLNYPRYWQYFKSTQSSLKLKLRTLNTYPTFCFQYPKGTENKGLMQQKKAFTSEKSPTPTGLVCETNIAAVLPTWWTWRHVKRLCMVTFPVNAGTVDGARIPVNKGTYSRLGVKVVCMKLSTQASEFPECGRGPLYNSL